MQSMKLLFSVMIGLSNLKTSFGDSSEKAIEIGTGKGCKQFTLSVNDLKDLNKIAEVQEFFKEQMKKLQVGEQATIRTTNQHQNLLSTPSPTTIISSSIDGPTVEHKTLSQTTEQLTSSAAPNVTMTTAAKEKSCYLGMKSGDIPNSSITASTEYNKNNHAAHRGRLDLHTFGWSARPSQIGEWIEVDLGEPKLVAGVITQGRCDMAQWVISYKVSCGSDIGSLTTITENGSDKIFNGNSDQDTKVTGKFPRPMTCRYVRIYPQTWHEWINMRLELIRGECYARY